MSAPSFDEADEELVDVLLYEVGDDAPYAAAVDSCAQVGINTFKPFIPDNNSFHDV